MLQALWDQGYSATDIISILFRVVRNNGQLHEFLKLEYIKVGSICYSLTVGWRTSTVLGAGQP